MKKTMEHTITALHIYDQGQDEREAAWITAQTDEDVLRAEQADKEALDKVRIAFHADTRENNNSPEAVAILNLSYIRWAATGHPGVGVVNIGNVGFGKLTGKTWLDGQPKTEYLPYMGQERVDLLRKVLDGKPLPEGIVLTGNLGGGFVQIPVDAVHWASSGLQRG